MKKHIVWILLLCPAFSLYAQSNNPSASVFVLPVTGTGSRADDNTIFYNHITSEIAYLHFNLAKALKDAEFYLIGAIFPHSDDANEPSGGKQYAFHLTLLDSKTNSVRAEGELVYEAPEDVNDLFPMLVHTLLHTIPDGTGKNNWRNKWLYFGGSAFWTPRVYTAENASTNIVNFGGGLFMTWHFLDFLSLEAGLEFAYDLIKVSHPSEDYSNILLEVPVLLKYVIKPGDYFILEPYAGIHFNRPLLKTTTPPLLSWLAGLQYGVKTGPGVLFIEPRFAMDIGQSGIEAASRGKEIPFQRYIIHLGIGYKQGFFTRR